MNEVRRPHLTIGSLFSGIGGLELGLEWAGLGPVVFQCEIDPFCRAVLAKHWPDVPRYEDVTRPRDYPAVDVLCGGFPCQDVSSAGARRGLGGDRSSLWYFFARVVRQVRPRFVVVENVASGAKAWLPVVRAQLRRLGYRTRALGIAASDVGAPHRRRRVFVVAYADRDPKLVEPRRRGGASRPDSAGFGWAGGEGVAANAHRDGEPSLPVDAEVGGAPELVAHADPPRREGAGPEAHEGWFRSPAGVWGPPLGGLVPVVHGVSGGLAGRRRRAQIRSLGNAVVPQCAQVVGEVILGMVK